LQFDNEWTKADEMAVHSLHDGWVGVDRGMLIHISFYVLAAVLSLCEEVDRAAATIYGEVGWLEARCGKRCSGWPSTWQSGTKIQRHKNTSPSFTLLFLE
jgi:hypothetical protein